ncbi:MAG: MlaD family protein, partial [Pseudomonadota bacterium]
MRSIHLQSLIGFVFAAILCLTVAGIVNFADRTNVMNLTAHFDNAQGIRVGSDVYVAGIRAGEVIDISLESDSWAAVAILQIASDLTIPSDSSVRILSNSFFGGKYVSINVGGTYDYLEDGDQFVFAQPSIDIVDIVERIVRNAESRKK